MMYYCQRLSCTLEILAEAASLQSQSFLLLTLHTVSSLLRTPLIPTKTVNFPRALVRMASSSKRGSYKFFFYSCRLYLSPTCCWLLATSTLTRQVPFVVMLVVAPPIVARLFLSHRRHSSSSPPRLPHGHGPCHVSSIRPSPWPLPR